MLYTYRQPTLADKIQLEEEDREKQKEKKKERGTRRPSKKKFKLFTKKKKYENRKKSK